MTHYFSPSEIGFYDEEIKQEYEKAGTWPADGLKLTEDQYKEFSGQAPDGKRLSSKNGKPIWGDVPELNDEDKLLINRNIQENLITEARNKIFLPQTKLLLGKASSSDKVILSNWIEYMESVQQVDLLKPEWPEAPTS